MKKIALSLLILFISTNVGAVTIYATNPTGEVQVVSVWMTAKVKANGGGTNTITGQASVLSLEVNADEQELEVALPAGIDASKLIEYGICATSNDVALLPGTYAVSTVDILDRTRAFNLSVTGKVSPQNLSFR